MKIAVCVRRTPSTETKVGIAADGRSLDPTGVSFVLNPYDVFAVEEAIRTKEALGGEITVITVGGSDSSKELKQALAMGADKAVRVDAGPDVDAGMIAGALAQALEELGPDLVLCGKMSVDEQELQVPVRVATALDMPAVTFVTKLEIGDGKATAEAETEAGVTVYETPLPALFAVEKGINEPRYPGIKGIMQAKKKPVDEKPTVEGALQLTVEKLELPAERQGGKMVGEGAEAVPELVRLLREEAKAL